jgi:hypothetical protein
MVGSGSHTGGGRPAANVGLRGAVACAWAFAGLGAAVEDAARACARAWSWAPVPGLELGCLRWGLFGAKRCAWHEAALGHDLGHAVCLQSQACGTWSFAWPALGPGYVVGRIAVVPHATGLEYALAPAAVYGIGSKLWLDACRGLKPQWRLQLHWGVGAA